MGEFRRERGDFDEYLHHSHRYPKADLSGQLHGIQRRGRVFMRCRHGHEYIICHKDLSSCRLQRSSTLVHDATSCVRLKNRRRAGQFWRTEHTTTAYSEEECEKPSSLAAGQLERPETPRYQDRHGNKSNRSSRTYFFCVVA